MNTIVITIGRNIGDRPMAVVQWIDFKLAIEALIREVGGTIIQKPEAYDGCQQGIWQGVREDAAAFIAFTQEWCMAAGQRGLDGGMDSITNHLRVRLSEIARRFEQQSVGFIVCAGTEHLVYAKS
jgi:hypothetical protein